MEGVAPWASQCGSTNGVVLTVYSVSVEVGTVFSVACMCCCIMIVCVVVLCLYVLLYYACMHCCIMCWLFVIEPGVPFGASGVGVLVCV